MNDRITSLSPETFATALSVGMFTDDEIAEWIRNNPLRAGSEKLQVLQAIGKLKGGPITGIIRTALREAEGLPPVPGDPI